MKRIITALAAGAFLLIAAPRAHALNLYNMGFTAQLVCNGPPCSLYGGKGTMNFQGTADTSCVASFLFNLDQPPDDESNWSTSFSVANSAIHGQTVATCPDYLYLSTQSGSWTAAMVDGQSNGAWVMDLSTYDNTVSGFVGGQFDWNKEDPPGFNAFETVQTSQKLTP